MEDTADAGITLQTRAPEETPTCCRRQMAPPPPPTSPPAVSSTSTSTSRPPARNKSSSALSSTTLKSQSSAASTTGKPRRNKSSASLVGQHHAAHTHGAGHHTVSFQHHRRASHGPPGLKRVGSASGASRKPTLGLGMTLMGHPDSADLAHDGAAAAVAAAPSTAQARRPSMSKRRTSSSSTVTAVSRPSHDRRSSGGGGGRRSRSNSTAKIVPPAGESETAPEQAGPRTDRSQTGPATGSVTSSSGGWESATDSPVRFGRNLPDTSEEAPPEDHSALAKALESQEQLAPAKPQQQQVPARGPGRKAKFQLGASDPFEDEEEEKDDDDGAPPARDQKVAKQAGTEPAIPPETQGGQVDQQGLDEDIVSEAEEGEIPAAAMPPAATAAVPSLPATIRAVAPPTPEDGHATLDPDDEQEAAGVAAPPPTSAPQHLSPPEIPPDESIDRSKSGASLLAAAQPELAFPNKPPSNPPSQVPTRAHSPHPEPATPPAGPTEPLAPNPTSIQRDREEREGGAPPPSTSAAQKSSTKHEQPQPPSPPRQQQQQEKPSSPAYKALPPPPRQHPVRKASDASIISTMSRRSYFDRPAPQFRRSASGVAPPSVDRDVTARGDFSGAVNEDQRTSEGPRRGSHGRGDSMNSMRSLRQATEPVVAPQARGASSLAPGSAQRTRSSESAGGAMAALGSIAAAAASRPSPGLAEPALSQAKRSASGYFNALRGFTSIPAPSSTPPLSPSASQSQRYPIPGPSSSSYTRSSSTRPRPSPSPRQPPLVVKFVEPPQVSGGAVSATPSERPAPVQRSTSPAAVRGNLSAQHRNASSASLGPMSRTQQKALLARDAPQYAGGEGAGGALVPPSGPGGLTPAQQQFLALQQQRAAAAAAAATASAASNNGAGAASAPGSGPPSSSASPAPGAQALNQGMQKWAFGLVREAERIERQYRAVEKWRDPLGESLERVLIVRQRARRRREDDREKVRQAIAAAAAAKHQQQQQLQPAGTGASTSAGKSRTGTPEMGMSGRSSVAGTSESESRPPSTRSKQRGELPGRADGCSGVVLSRLLTANFSFSLLCRSGGMKGDHPHCSRKTLDFGFSLRRRSILYCGMGLPHFVTLFMLVGAQILDTDALSGSPRSERTKAAATSQ